jgi:hypothetical protein
LVSGSKGGKLNWMRHTKECRGKHLDLTGRKIKENGKNYVLITLIIYTLQKIVGNIQDSGAKTTN